MNKINLFPFLFLVVLFFSCQGVSQKSNKMESEKYLHTNKLIKSSSPYLLQHAYNPIDWYPWGREALEKVKKENKLLIISIGYSSCHWCHVMEKETFEDDSVAKLMNEHFVNIKVDREERPDIDDIYMNVAHMITGRGGWPLNIIATADQKPVYAGTYFSKKQWIELLSKVTQYKKENKGGLEDMGEKIVQKLKEGNLVIPSGLNQVNQRQYEKWIDLVKNTRDYSYGGSLGAPKFPMPIVFEMLFNEYLRKKDEKLEGYLRNSLYQMSNGGIYDHVGGCFSRYSIDEQWRVPHFEKMLYDNAQLIYIYAKGYNLLKEERFKKVVEESVQFMFDEMQSSYGFFYSAYDADSEGVEGKYYVWTIAQLNFLKQEEQDFLMKYMNVSRLGNWEHSNILYISPEKQEVFETTKMQKQWFKIRKKLKKERAKRIKPLLDDKAITAWNMLLLKNLVLCGQLLDRKDWIQKVEKQMEVFLSKMLDETKNTARLKRIYKDEKVTISAFLDDYAITINALITLYQANLNPKWLLQAKRLLEYVNKEFSHEDNIYYYFTEKNAEQLIHRKLEFSDNVIPSSNAFMASNLITLGNLLYNKEWVSRAKKMVSQLSESIEKGNPSFYAKWVMLYENFLNPPYEVAVVGNDAVEVLAKLSRRLPKSVILFGASKESDTKEVKLLDNKWVEGKTMIYVCQNKVCKYPTEDIEKAISLMK